jgi:hypothetical protein
LALSEGEPENRFLYGIAGFYLECSGTVEAAAFYFGKAGPLAADQFAEFLRVAFFLLAALPLADESLDRGPSFPQVPASNTLPLPLYLP